MTLHERLQLACDELGISPETEISTLEDTIEEICSDPQDIAKRSALVCEHRGKFDTLKRRAATADVGPLNLSWVQEIGK